MYATRNVGEKISYYKRVLIEDVGIREEIININHSVKSRQITIYTNLFNTLNEVIKEETVLIDGNYYLQLMPDEAVFEEGKERNVYRDSDLWYIVDKIRSN